MKSSDRLSWDDYYMNIAWVVAQRSSCLRRKVGSIVVVRRTLPDSVTVSTGIASAGFNGTPFGVQNCLDGGCPRCASDAPAQVGYDWCLCVHAEQNAIALAARHGISTLGATLYVTLRPCLTCLKECIQAGIRTIIYDRPDTYPEGDMESSYQMLREQSHIVLTQHSFSTTHPDSLPEQIVANGTGPERPMQ